MFRSTVLRSRVWMSSLVSISMQKPKTRLKRSGGGLGIEMRMSALSHANRCSLRPKVASCDVYVFGSGRGLKGEGVGLENAPKSNSGAVPKGKLAFSNVG